jgi:serine protease Do
VAVPFVVRRGDQGLTLTVTPLAREANEARELELTAWGLTVRNLTRMSALYTKRPDTQGVMVDSLRPGGPSAEAKPALMDGDIILTVAGRPVANAAALRQVSRELLQDKTEPEPVLVGFARGSSQMLSVVRVGPEVDPAIAPRAPKPWAGVATQVLTAEIAKALNLKGKAGVRITQVLPNSNAEKAGLKVGDLLVKLDGKVIPARRPEDSEVFAALLREYPVGTDVALDVLRDGQALAVTLHLAEVPAPPSELPTVKDARFGFSARQLGYDDKVQRKVSTETQGVIVTKVERSGWADLSGLRSGDIVYTINGTPVTDNLTLRAALTQLAAAKPRHVVFQVRRSISGAYLEFEPDWSAFESTK